MSASATSQSTPEPSPWRTTRWPREVSRSPTVRKLLKLAMISGRPSPVMSATAGEASEL